MRRLTTCVHEDVECDEVMMKWHVGADSDQNYNRMPTTGRSSTHSSLSIHFCEDMFQMRKYSLSIDPELYPDPTN